MTSQPKGSIKSKNISPNAMVSLNQIEGLLNQEIEEAKKAEEAEKAEKKTTAKKTTKTTTAKAMGYAQREKMIISKLNNNSNKNLFFSF